jgi:hypothetical protein
MGDTETPPLIMFVREPLVVEIIYWNAPATALAVEPVSAPPLSLFTRRCRGEPL